MNSLDNPRDSFGILSKCRFIPKGIKCLKIEQQSKLFTAVWYENYITIYNCVDQKNKQIFKELRFTEKVC